MKKFISIIIAIMIFTLQLFPIMRPAKAVVVNPVTIEIVKQVLLRCAIGAGITVASVDAADNVVTNMLSDMPDAVYVDVEDCIQHGAQVYYDPITATNKGAIKVIDAVWQWIKSWVDDEYDSGDNTESTETYQEVTLTSDTHYASTSALPIISYYDSGSVVLHIYRSGDQLYFRRTYVATGALFDSIHHDYNDNWNTVGMTCTVKPNGEKPNPIFFYAR